MAAIREEPIRTREWAGRRAWPRPQLGVLLGDVAMWAVGLSLATWGRLDFDWGRVDVGLLLVAVGIAAGLSVLCGLATGLYLGIRRLGSFEEALSVALCSLVATLGLVVVVAVAPDPHLVPLSAALAGGAYQLIGALGLRYVRRSHAEARPRHAASDSHRVLVFGAGEAGRSIAKALLADEESDLLPVALLDDDPDKALLRLHGLRVAGGRHDIAAAAAHSNADTLLIAIPSAPPDERAAIADIAQQAGLAVKILPSASERVVDQPNAVSNIREFTVADFLGRPEVNLNIEEVAAFVTGRRVLVTGAGGFIGSALAETLARFGPRRLTLADHDENLLYALALRLSDATASRVVESVLVDIRDRRGVWQQFSVHTPDIVFHAAAHKHVDMLERHPSEAFKTNVLGTLNVLQAAAATGTEVFVNVSTDKAANPIGALGASKRIGEMLTAHYAEVAGAAYMSVRFGNVLGSTGSVLHTFRHQLEAGQPLTVTHPDVARYFMTAEEAVRLVVQASAVGRGGDVLVLDMGEPVKIVDLVRLLAAELRPGREPEIVFVGLRPGEKLVESAVAADDVLVDHPHERVSRYRVPTLDRAVLEGLEEASDEVVARRMLHLAAGGAWEPTDLRR